MAFVQVRRLLTSTLFVRWTFDGAMLVLAQPAYGAGLPALLNRYIPWRARKEVLRRFAGSSREQVRVHALPRATICKKCNLHDTSMCQQL
jgi:hypothetical protein